MFIGTAALLLNHHINDNSKQKSGMANCSDTTLFSYENRYKIATKSLHFHKFFNPQHAANYRKYFAYKGGGYSAMDSAAVSRLRPWRPSQKSEIMPKSTGIERTFEINVRPFSDEIIMDTAHNKYCRDNIPKKILLRRSFLLNNVTEKMMCGVR
jgi:hypothetical protein